eukprot:gene19457-23134_t
MQHETHSHGINMSALGRDKQSLSLAQETVAIEVPGLSLYYGDKQALYDVSMNIPKQRGAINLYGTNIYRKGEDVAELRRRVGMVFQKPNPFPKTIYENVVYGLRIQGINKKRVLDEAVEWALKGAALWDEAARVSDYTAFMYMGKLVEFGDTDTLFTNPAKKQTEDYITGRYG